MKQLWRLITLAVNAIRRNFFCFHNDRIEVKFGGVHEEYVSRVTKQRYRRERTRSIWECPDCGYVWKETDGWSDWHKLNPASEQEAETKSGGVVPPPKQIEMTYFPTDPDGKVRPFIREGPDDAWEQILFPREID